MPANTRHMIESYPSRQIAMANLPYWAKQAEILKVPGLLYVAPVPGIPYYFGIFAEKVAK